MKKLMLVLLSMVILSGAMAQLTAKSKCPDFTVDILDGKVNGLKPSATNFDIKAKFPCSTSSEEEGTTAKCGTSVSFKDKDIYFYTQRAYIEIGPKFKGKTLRSRHGRQKRQYVPVVRQSQNKRRQMGCLPDKLWHAGTVLRCCRQSKPDPIQHQQYGCS